MRRPKLVFVSARYLLPADSGGAIRTGQILRGLKGGRFEVILAAPAPPGAVSRDAAELTLLCDRFAAWPTVARRRLHRFTRLRHILSALPIPVRDDISRAGRRVVAEELAQNPELVVVDFVHAAVLLPERLAMPSLLFTHNVESEIFARHSAVAGSAPLRALWNDQRRKMWQFERAALKRFDSVVAVSDRDQRQFAAEFGVAAEIIPTGVDLDFFRFDPAEPTAEEPNIVFTASMDSFANIDGVQWFMDEIWPLVAAQQPNARVTIVGRNPDAKLVRYARERRLPWRFTGSVPDIRPYVRDAHIYVIPLRVGGGTRIKAYEAMALGRAVVSTAVGIEGLGLEAGRHYLEADAPGDFAASIVRLIHDAALRKQLADEALRFVAARFSARRAAQIFESICWETLKKATASRRAIENGPAPTERHPLVGNLAKP